MQDSNLQDAENPVHGRNDNDYWNRCFLLFLFSMLLLRLIMALYLDLTPDETYYWELSRRLDWSYLDHPPMVAYIIAFFRLFFGDTAFAVRIFPIINIGIITGILYITGRDFLGNAKTGFLAALMPHITPAGIALGFIMTPDVPLSCFWSIAALAFLLILRNPDKTLLWAILGAALGLGAMSKYNMIFFVPAVALSLLAFKDRRKLVGSGRFLLMFLLALAGTLPILWWNHQHDWASFRFQFHHGFKVSQRSALMNLGEFIGGQMVTIGPVLFPMLWITVFTGIMKKWREKDEFMFFLVMLVLPTMLLFAYTSFSSKVEANWPQVAYLSAMPLLAHRFALEKSRSCILWTILPSIIITSIVVFQAFTLLLPMPGRSDVSKRLHGWTQMGEILRKIDMETGKSAMFVGQGPTLASLIGFFGGIEPDRVAEIHGKGNWRYWRNSLVKTGGDVVYIDECRHSEAQAYVSNFREGESRRYDLFSHGRFVRTITVTLMRDNIIPIEFK